MAGWRLRLFLGAREAVLPVLVLEQEDWDADAANDDEEPDAPGPALGELALPHVVLVVTVVAGHAVGRAVDRAAVRRRDGELGRLLHGVAEHRACLVAEGEETLALGDHLATWKPPQKQERTRVGFGLTD